MRRTLLTVCVLVHLIVFSAGTTRRVRGHQLDEFKDPSGRFVAYEQYVEESKIWHSVLQSVCQVRHTNSAVGAEFQLVSTNVSLDAVTHHPSIPAHVTIGFEYRPCHLHNPWTPKVTLHVDGRLICDLALRGEQCAGGPGRETEFGTADITLDDFRRLARANTLAVRVDDVETEINPLVGEAFRWFAAWQLGKPFR